MANRARITEDQILAIILWFERRRAAFQVEAVPTQRISECAADLGLGTETVKRVMRKWRNGVTANPGIPPRPRSWARQFASTAFEPDESSPPEEIDAQAVADDESLSPEAREQLIAVGVTWIPDLFRKKIQELWTLGLSSNVVEEIIKVRRRQYEGLGARVANLLIRHGIPPEDLLAKKPSDLSEEVRGLSNRGAEEVLEWARSRRAT